MMKLEQRIITLRESRRFGILQAFLYVGSLFYKGAVWMRHLFYKVKLLRAEKSSLPVISVGNIVCGGTGKSEFVYKLINDLDNPGIAILSRGYRSKRVGSSRLVKDSDDGDEPYMLQSRLPEHKVIVGREREKSAALAKKLGAKAALLDDGMQYLKLKKDLQIILVRAQNPFGGGFVPFGMRRELLSQLRIADYVVVHGAESEENYELVKRSLLCYTSAKCFGTRYCLDKNKKLIGMKVGVFCGVGNPQFFMKGLKELGLSIVKKKILSDHEEFKGLEEFCLESKQSGAQKVVCTTKDYVKLTDKEKSLVTPIELDMKISFDDEQYQDLLKAVNNNIGI